MAAKAELEFKTLLLATGLVQPITSISKGGRLEVLCKQMPRQEPGVVKLITSLLSAAEPTDLSIHVCKRFILKNGKLAFGWNFAVNTINSKSLDAAIQLLRPVLEAIEPSLDDLDVESETQRQSISQPIPTTEVPAVDPKDRKTLRKNGVTVDPAAGIIGKLEERPGQYQVGKRLSGARLSILEVGIDSDGRQTMIAEMPLPHVTRELNVPTHEGGRGATLSGKRIFTFGKRRVQ